MKSIFHVFVDTPEELRQELTTWLKDRLVVAEATIRLGRTRGDRHTALGEANAYRQTLEFWRQVNIDPSEGRREQKS